jgi:hypothetical protein
MPTVTTFIDLYKLHKDFPDYKKAQSATTLNEKLDVLLRGFQQDIITTVGCDPNRFIPHIQPYEFEALLFSDIDELIALEEVWKKSKNILQKIRNNAESPEHINDSPSTKPAAHLERELKDPPYKKTRHGPIAAKKIGLSRIESECQFFKSWIEKLRNV